MCLHQLILLLYFFTDLKKTMAVLLDSILERLNKLEKKVDSAITNGTLNIRNISAQEPGGHNDSDINNDIKPQELKGKILCGYESIPRPWMIGKRGIWEVLFFRRFGDFQGLFK